MNINEVIKYPILSEKTYKQMSEGTYTFVVDKRTNKVEIRKVVEMIFDVKVEKVNIMNYDKKPKRLGKYRGFTNSVKKAIVFLKEGSNINFFPDEGKNNEQNNDKQSESKVLEASPSDAEKRAAAKIAAKLEEKKEEVSSN